VRGCVAGALATLLVAAPRLASGCSVCGGGANDQTQGGFLVGSLLLSILPLALIGGIALWIRRRVRQMADDEAAGVIRLPQPLPPRSPNPGSAHPAAR
jgi:hypothetical protein